MDYIIFNELKSVIIIYFDAQIAQDLAPGSFFKLDSLSFSYISVIHWAIFVFWHKKEKQLFQAYLLFSLFQLWKNYFFRRPKSFR